MLNLSSRRGIVPYLLAAAVVLVMTGLRWLLVPTLGDQLPFTTLIIAVLIAAWYGGLSPAVFATAVSALLALFLFLPPIYSLQLVGNMGGLRLLLFSATGVIAGLLGAGSSLGRCGLGVIRPSVDGEECEQSHSPPFLLATYISSPC